MLANVKSAVTDGHKIAVSWIQIFPESLRHFVEDELINQLKPNWNSHGK